jgi:hypothetical protein
MKNLTPETNIAGWTAAQWVTAINTVRGNQMPAINGLTAARNFISDYLLAHESPAPYKGKDLDAELLEVSLILEAVLTT